MEHQKYCTVNSFQDSVKDIGLISLRPVHCPSRISWRMHTSTKQGSSLLLLRCPPLMGEHAHWMDYNGLIHINDCIKFKSLVLTLTLRQSLPLELLRSPLKPTCFRKLSHIFVCVCLVLCNPMCVEINNKLWALWATMEKRVINVGYYYYYYYINVFIT